MIRLRIHRPLEAALFGALLALAAAVHAGPGSAGPPSVAFYYGDDMPVDALAQFDWAVVETAHVDERELAGIRRHGTEVFAYVSVGEVERWRGRPEGLPDAAILGENEAWDSEVADLTHPAWRTHLIEHRIAPLWQAGYRGFFLDTLDSFRLVFSGSDEIRVQRDALADLIRALRERFPGIQLILNRGFEVLDEVHGGVRAVAAESLYRRWDPAAERYVEVPEANRDYLLAQLRRARDDYDLPVIAIDYVPPARRELARETARRIDAHGFIPWVSNPALDQVGVGRIEPVPRKVLILHNATGEEVDDIAETNAHLFAAMPLEYLGYGAVYHDVGSALPAGTLRGRYAGVVTWFDGAVPDPDAYRQWLLRQLDDGVPVAMLGDPGVSLSGELAKRLGVREATDLVTGDVTVLEHDAMLGFEGMMASPPPTPNGVRTTGPDVTAHLRLSDGGGTEHAAVVTGPWGGLALTPWLVEIAPTGQQRWLLDPFRFFRSALRLPEMPVPDATTENGSRLLLTHIDGDAFVGRAALPGNPFNSRVILDRILRKYRLPTTVSIIQGEIGPEGLYPDLNTEMEEIAREIFRLPWVELATHTYSHPFSWGNLGEGDVSGLGETAAGYAYNLPIPGYEYSLEKEIAGTAAYVDRELAPPGKRVELVLWTGDALPPARALAIAEREGLLNLNGGNTSVTRDNPSLTAVSPMLRPVGDYLQVYAPQTNENVYTNLMTGPLWGYRRVIETYELTDRPRRLKPINIYYHFYSGASEAALAALREVYEYALAQETLPVHASTYSRLAQAWYRMGLARRLDGGWQITGAEDIRTLRLPAALGWPDLAASSGVAGVRQLPQGRYVALSGSARAILNLRPEPPATPHLVRANGRIVDWRREEDVWRLRLRSAQVPLRVTLGGVNGCRVRVLQGAAVERRDEEARLVFQDADSGPVEVSCE